VVVLAALGLTGLAGCGSAGGAGRTVASLPGGHRTAGHGTGPPNVAQTDADFVAFAHCMRAHGVEMSDPFHRPGHAGLSINLPTRDQSTRAAYAACNKYIAPIIVAKQQGGAARSPQVMAALTEYAHCMRAHDISMLDPTQFGGLNLGTVPGITNDFGRYSPQFRSADAACRHLLPAGVHDDGTGP
jgi:hypothetical protein